MERQENQNHVTRYSYIKFIVSTMDIELGNCKEGNFTENGKFQKC